MAFCPDLAVAGEGASTCAAKVIATSDLILAIFKTSPFLHVCSCMCMHTLCQNLWDSGLAPLCGQGYLSELKRWWLLCPG